MTQIVVKYSLRLAPHSAASRSRRWPGPLPLAGHLLDGILAAWAGRRIPNGFGPRRLLPRLLLVSDDAVVRGRGDEPILDRRSRPLRAAGEARPRRSMAESRQWRYPLQC